MAVNILVGKSRHQSRSDREREKLQSQISTYALRFHAESDAVERRKLEQRLESPPAPRLDSKLDSFIDRMLDLVNSVFPCRHCGHSGAHEISCPDLDPREIRIA